MTTKTTRTEVLQEQSSTVLQLANRRNLSLETPIIMGILNVTPDSFSDGGKFDQMELAVKRALEMEQEGAAIIDIGGESTRPGATEVSPETEQARVLPVIRKLRLHSDIPISIDSYHASTAGMALDSGADIVNDISALRFDQDIGPLLSSNNCSLILMHMQGKPGNMQKKPHYDNCLEEIGEFFRERIQFCEEIGIKRSRLILDPGIGFGKSVEHNCELLAGLHNFSRFDLPLMVGASRKRFISDLHIGALKAEERIGGSVAASLVAVKNGASIVRVHDVAPTVEAIRVWRGIQEQG